MSNPLLEKFTNPHGARPFDTIKNEHYMPAIREAIKMHKEEIEAIKNFDGELTFANIIEPYANSGSAIEDISMIFFNLKSANTNDEMNEIAKEFSPLLTAHGNDVNLDADLFAKVKVVFDNKENEDLNAEQMTLLTKIYKGFVRNGALLSEEDKNKVRKIDEELSKLGLEFSDNLLKETNKFEMVLDNKEDLAGLPEGLIEAAAMTATEKGHEGKWVFTLDYPSFGPFITYAQNRELRKKMTIASGTKCAKGDELDNQENVKRIAQLRFERAGILGYKSHADYILEERMAMSAQNVFDLLNNLKEKAMPAAIEHMDEVKAYAKEQDGVEDFSSWDYMYYYEKLKKERYSIDDEMLKPYFKLENVLNGVFEVATKLYGLNFKEVSNVPKYHQDVMTYEITDRDGNFISLFYGDYFPRASKRGGAWMTAFREQYVLNGEDIRPHIANVCNFTKPTTTKPSLLTFNEVTTLFHEFGHALHGILTKCQYRMLSGPNVFWDFVELPSQIMENWAFEKECLDLFAKHYETGELIPAELVQKLKDSSNFGEGRHTIRQLSLGLLDMAWHSGDPSNITNVEEFENLATQDVQLLPKVAGTMVSTSFGHIFAGGYSAGYYSYKWAEVLDADAFELFLEEGIFNTTIADRFRENILEKGGSEHPMDLYKKFRGREPEVDALLRRGGLI
ncbi:M3 family metallopeptidase [Halobacteriovorax sp. CON-3]|uniref:M3 family metallopeptidase n=1 Tax=Halobacteriovorax sp. CON-3 TaxID=3157710 RepID=UPI00371B69BD